MKFSLAIWIMLLCTLLTTRVALAQDRAGSVDFVLEGNTIGLQVTSTPSPTLTLVPPAHTQTSEPPTEPAKQGRPTRTPRPTATPPVIPPSADPAEMNLVVAFGVLSVIIVLVGVWINRRRVI